FRRRVSRKRHGSYPSTRQDTRPQPPRGRAMNSPGRKPVVVGEARADPVEVFRLRCASRAKLWHTGQIDLHSAVNELQRVRAIMKIADQGWSDDRLKGGLSSGEGLINEVRDERREWNRNEGREEIVDPGITDKRLMIVEAEFASALAVMERAGNTLSSHIRRAWDGDKLSTITRNSPLCATGAHISIVGHITIE